MDPRQEIVRLPALDNSDFVTVRGRVPSCTAISFIGAGLPSRLRTNCGSCIPMTPPPINARVMAPCTQSSVSPPREISIVVASGGFPKARLAIAKALRSIAPEAATPKRMKPGRPPS